jgi:hypothetical protein
MKKRSLFGDGEVVFSLKLRKGVVVLVGEMQHGQEAQCRTDEAVAAQEVTVYVRKLYRILLAAFDVRANQLLGLSDASVPFYRRPSALLALATQIDCHSLLPKACFVLRDFLWGDFFPGL